MTYVITGGTGFIGKHLIDRLVLRGEPIYVIVREKSRGLLTELIETRWATHKALIHALEGDITEQRCGLSDAAIAELTGKVKGLYHLAAIYDLGVSEEAAWKANVEGTEHTVELAHALASPLHLVSSIAITGGVIDGVFKESMFDEGQKLTHPYYRTKLESEALVRRTCKVPYRVYRPGVVVGSSENGEADKVDGPYYAFELFRLMRRSWPRYLPMLGFDRGVLNVVPVDYVAKAIDALSHMEGLDGRAFHLVQRKAPTLFEATQLFAKAAGAPRFLKLPNALARRFGARTDKRPGPLAEAIKQGFIDKLGIPASVLDAAEWRTRFDTSETERLLGPMGIVCPELSSYVQKLWDYWEENLSHSARRRKLKGTSAQSKREHTPRTVRGKRVLITGASSGIGEAISLRVAKDGGIPIMVARSMDKLAALRAQIEAEGGKAEVFSCDLSVPSDIDLLVEKLRHEPSIDVLVNNAGRSIRRSIAHSYDRMHDFERTMQLNYFGALRLTMGLLPRMRAEKNGHIINISSAGVPVNTPRFSAYLASKAAFDTWSNVAAGEVRGDRVRFTTVYMPLVRTKMIAPTKGYEKAPALSPEEAADWVVRAMITRPRRLIGRFASAMHMGFTMAPQFMDKALNVGYRYTPGGAKRTPTASVAVAANAAQSGNSGAPSAA